MLFADLSGFTALSETLDAEEVRALVNDCFDVLVPVIETYSGTVDKFIGDEVMALFGAPLAHEDDAARALSAACEMMTTFAGFAGTRRLDLGIHVGIETGTVVTGGLGSRGREDYSVIGDAVNVAARLSDAAGVGEILVGPATQHLAADGFDFLELAPLDLKGKAAPLPVFLLKGERSAAARQRRPMISSPLVGRDAEVADLSHALRDLQAGSGGVVGITGEPGLGKSRLAAEGRISSPAGIRWAEGRGQAYGRTLSYGVAAGLLDELCGSFPGSAGAQAEEGLRSTVGYALPDAASFAAVYPYLAQLRGVELTPPEDERVRHLSPEALHGRMLEAFTVFIRELSRREPLVLVWEDLHWADPSSLGIAEALLPLTAECQLLVLLLFRPHEGSVDEWYARATDALPISLRHIELAPLDPIASGMLVEHLLQIEDLPTEIRRLIIGKAEGNPFFLEELLRSLLDAGVVVVDGNRVVTAADWAEFSIPDTMQGVTAARIDALMPDDKQTLQNASVIGRVFQHPVLVYLCERGGTEGGRSIGQVDASLDELRRRQFVRRHDEAAFIFDHVVTQQVAYGTLLLARRRALHRVVAQAIEELFPDDLDTLAATLAHHWRVAGVHDRALSCLLAAADRARRTYSNIEALELFKAALEEAGDAHPQQALMIQESIGDLLLLGSRAEEARAHFDAARLDAREEDTLTRARLLRKAATTYIPGYAADAAGEAFEQAELVLGPHPVDEAEDWWREWVGIQTERVWLCYWMNDTAAMGILLKRAEEALQLPAARSQRGALLRMLTLLELRQTRYHPSAQAVHSAGEYVEIARRQGDLGELAWALAASAFMYLWYDDLDAAVAQFEEALALSRRIGDMSGEIRALTYLAVARRRRGELEAVRLLARQSIDLATAARLPEYVGSGRGNLAWLAWREGDARQTAIEGESAWEALRQCPADPFLWIALWPLLAVRLAEGDTGTAVQLAERLLAPSQMRLPEDIEAPLRAAARAWEDDDEDTARARLTFGVQAAQSSAWGWL